MPVRLKPASEQVILILAGSSGIGRETTLQAARDGANVVLAAQNDAALCSLVDE
jgi:NAD(P)-dependent dehydrogenase (short-subunit alcohol dehydrogenase family)